MAEYGIMRIEKYHAHDCTGIRLEANRERGDNDKRDFPGSDIDWDKTGENIFLRRSDNWQKDASALCAQYDIKPRKDSVLIVGGFYGVSASWCEEHTREEQMQYFEDCLKFHEEHYGPVINAVVHFDETTPHMQVAAVPLCQDEKGVHLSAKTLCGSPRHMVQLQDAFYEDVCKDRGLDRGESATITKRRHKNTLDHKIERSQERLDNMRQDIEQAKTVIEQAEAVESVSQDVVEGNTGLNLGVATIISRKDMKAVKKALGVSERLINEAQEVKDAYKDIDERNRVLDYRETSQNEREQALNERERHIGEEVRQGIERGLQKAQERLQGLINDMRDIFKGVPLYKDTKSRSNELLFGSERLDYIKDEYGEDYPELTEACLAASKAVDEARDVRKYADIGRAVVELPEKARNGVRDVIASSDKRAARELDDFTKEKTRGRDVGFTR